MKRLIFALCVTLCLGACGPQKSSPGLARSSTMWTLDGRTKSEADTVVANFTEDNSNSDKRTNVWFSSKWVSQVRALLDSEKKADKTVDGFRIYFAKENDRNSLVIVSTKQIKPDTIASSVNNHQDYFEHSSAYLSTVRSANASPVDYLIDYPMVFFKGAKLYKGSSPCPAIEGCVITELNHGIKCGDAYRYITNFKNKKPINTIAEWFPLSLLQALDDELTAAKKNNVQADGIRIYFARKSKRNVFIFATTQTVGSDHEDYYNCYGGNNKAVNDHGEECPLNCSGFTWPEPDPGP